MLVAVLGVGDCCGSSYEGQRRVQVKDEFDVLGVSETIYTSNFSTFRVCWFLSELPTASSQAIRTIRMRHISLSAPSLVACAAIATSEVKIDPFKDVWHRNATKDCDDRSCPSL